MELVLRPCERFSACYIDDVIIFSASWEEHITHVRHVLEALAMAGLTAKYSKCCFGFRFLEYLGHVIGDGKVAVPQQRVTALEEYKRPKTKTDLRAFLGMIEYYRKSIKGFAKMSSLLTPAVAKCHLGSREGGCLCQSV